MVRDGDIPRVDPYSFTAGGQPWVVQSWLVDAIYGLLWRAGGATAVVAFHALLGAAVAAVMAMLACTGSFRNTSVVVATTLALAAPGWSQRPLMVGTLAFTALVLVVERRFSWLWMLPLGVIWVNSHSSWPLGLAWLFAVGVGTRLDGLDLGPLLRRGGALVAGIALGAIYPLGWRLLTFPLVAVGERREIFAKIVEWGPPQFSSPVEIVRLVALLAAVAVLVRCRPPWRYTLPVIVFLGASLLALRNLSALGIVLAPALALALSERASLEEGLGTAVRRIALGALLAATVVLGGRVGVQDNLDLSAYPVTALEALRADPPERLATMDFVGGYQIFAAGEKAEVFFDDRFDMYPLPVSRDAFTLLHLDGDPSEVLDRRQIDAVVWKTDQPLSRYLLVAPSWRLASENGEWSTFRRLTPLGAK